MKRSPAETLADRVRQDGECLIWTGARDSNGYGMLRVDSKAVRVHRIAWSAANGDIPSGLMIDHICMNKACVRIEHLRLATNKQNMEHLKGAKANSKTGVRGVTFVARVGKYRATLNHNQKQIWLGYHETLADAERAACEGRAKYFTHAEENAA